MNHTGLPLDPAWTELLEERAHINRSRPREPGEHVCSECDGAGWLLVIGDDCRLVHPWSSAHREECVDQILCSYCEGSGLMQSVPILRRIPDTA